MEHLASQIKEEQHQYYHGGQLVTCDAVIPVGDDWYEIIESGVEVIGGFKVIGVYELINHRNITAQHYVFLQKLH